MNAAAADGPAAVSGVLLAAGAGRRLGQPKAELVIRGERLLDRGVAVLYAAGCSEVVAVVRDDTGAPTRASVTAVRNPEPDRGMGSSLRLGLTACTGEIAVVMLVDTPGVGAEAVRAVIGAVRAGSPVAIAEFDGRRLPPVAFARPQWDRVAELADGDRGARGFLRAHPELVTAVACPGDPSDVDTPQDLIRWQNKTAADDVGRLKSP